MANIKTGSIVSEIRGKVGDEIYSRNQSGAYVKAYASPIQPDTTVQLNAQSDMASAISAWQSLSDDERTEWINYAQSTSVTKHLGGKRNQTGYGLFVKRKLNLLTIGNSNDPSPVNSSANGIYTAIIDFTAPASFRVTASFDEVTDNTELAIYMSPPTSPSAMSFNSTRFTLIDTMTAESGTSDNLLSTYISIFSNPGGSVGDKIFLQTRLVRINPYDGTKSPASYSGVASPRYNNDVWVIDVS